MNFVIEEITAAQLAHDPQRLDDLAELWEQAFGSHFALSATHLAHRLTAPPDWPQALLVATNNHSPRGFALVSAPESPGAKRIYLDALVLPPGPLQIELGRALLAWITDWGKKHTKSAGARETIWGSGPLRLMPGLPAGSPITSLCEQLDFSTWGEPLHDLACDLAGYEPPAEVTEIPGLVRPLGQTEQSHLRTFLAQHTHTLQQWSLTYFQSNGGRMSDIMALWTDEGIAGAAQIIVEDSLGGIEPWFPYTLPKPWAALRLILPDALQAAFRWAVIDAALRRLHNMGVNSCILADVRDPAQYAVFGFRPYHTFQRYIKF